MGDRNGSRRSEWIKRCRGWRWAPGFGFAPEGSRAGCLGAGLFWLASMLTASVWPMMGMCAWLQRMGLGRQPPEADLLIWGLAGLCAALCSAWVCVRRGRAPAEDEDPAVGWLDQGELGWRRLADWGEGLAEDAFDGGCAAVKRPGVAGWLGLALAARATLRAMPLGALQGSVLVGWAFLASSRGLARLAWSELRQAWAWARQAWTTQRSATSPGGPWRRLISQLEREGRGTKAFARAERAALGLGAKAGKKSKTGKARERL